MLEEGGGGVREKPGSLTGKTLVGILPVRHSHVAIHRLLEMG